MPYSFWKDVRGYESVSINETLPGPVVGYLIPTDAGWLIEGDEPATVYTNKDEVARVLVERYRNSN
jgi:hypothetical protein